MFNPFSSMMSIWSGRPLPANSTKVKAVAPAPIPRLVNWRTKREPGAHPIPHPWGEPNVVPYGAHTTHTTVKSTTFKATSILPSFALGAGPRDKLKSEKYGRTIWTDEGLSSLPMPPPTLTPRNLATATTATGMRLNPAALPNFEADFGEASIPVPKKGTFAFHLDVSQILEEYRDAKLEDCIDTVGTYQDVFEYPDHGPKPPTTVTATCPIHSPKPERCPNPIIVEALHERAVQELEGLEERKEAVFLEDSSISPSPSEQSSSSGDSSITYFVPETDDWKAVMTSPDRQAEEKWLDDCLRELGEDYTDTDGILPEVSDERNVPDDGDLVVYFWAERLARM